MDTFLLSRGQTHGTVAPRVPCPPKAQTVGLEGSLSLKLHTRKLSGP